MKDEIIGKYYFSNNKYLFIITHFVFDTVFNEIHGNTFYKNAFKRIVYQVFFFKNTINEFSNFLKILYKFY